MAGPDGEANPNLLPKAMDSQKYVHLTGDQVKAFATKCGLNLPERVLKGGVVFIGPDSDQHYEIVASGLGIKSGEEGKLKEMITSMNIENAGILIGIGNQSILTGRSETLNHRSGVAIRDIPEKEKRGLDDNTMVFLNEIYGSKWKFIPPIA